MLHSLKANKPTFHTVTFEPGLNLIVSNRGVAGEQREVSNNRLGKSTLIAIIDFCLGAKATANSEVLPMGQLGGWEFTLDATLGDVRVQVTRAVDDRNNVYVCGQTDRLSIASPTYDMVRGAAVYPIEHWKTILGNLLFNLPADGSGPFSSRHLIPYFIRQEFQKAISPVRSTALVQEKRLAFLYGMNWQYVDKIETLNKELERSETIKKGEELRMEDWRLTAGTLQNRLHELEAQILQGEQELRQFCTNNLVQAQTGRADELTAQMKLLRQKMCQLRDRKREANRASEADEIPFGPFEQVYLEAGLAFAPGQLESIDRVRQFHDRLTHQRQTYFRAEIARLDGELRQVAADFRRLDEERAQVFEYLSQNVALDDLNRQQNALNDKRLEKDKLSECRDRLAASTHDMERLRVDRIAEHQRAVERHANEADVWRRISQSFVDFGHRLYGSDYHCGYAIRLKSGAGKSFGYDFKPVFPDQRSAGCKQMSLFAFDMTTFSQRAFMGFPIDFMIHDSVVYDSTDAVQDAIAIGIAAQFCRENNVQYICAISGDKMSAEGFAENLPEGTLESANRFDLIDDGTPASRLLGITFEVEFDAASSAS